MAKGFSCSVTHFIAAKTDEIIGALVASVAQAGIESQSSSQVRAWTEEIEILKRNFSELIKRLPRASSWSVILEYELPRRHKRPDVILISDGLIFVIEFKLGAEVHDASARWQVEEYCLNLRDFHAESAPRVIVPVLCASEAAARSSVEAIESASKGVLPIALANKHDLCSVLVERYLFAEPAMGEAIDLARWTSSPYRPTLSIIEAAERLYERHDVREISHKYAKNLDATTAMLADAIRDAKENKRHCVCFVTGVPGAGKTLTGLNIVHDPALRSQQDGPSAIFLSGNGPLVKVVREALVLSQKRKGRRRHEAEHEVTTFIQNVHQFLRYHRENESAVPHEHVVVFDEAQRAWDQAQMLRKQKVNASEAAVLMQVMERWSDWAVIVALVGGGQEIFVGEAGLEEWGRAISSTRKSWYVVASPEVLVGGSSVAGHRLFAERPPTELQYRAEPAAHLDVGVRSVRAQRIADWVNALLEIDSVRARNCSPHVREFPLVVTRNLELARTWLRARSGLREDSRCGLIGTSEDQRSRAYGIESSSAFRISYPFEKWFLAPTSDVRSSFALEVAASEFECQGLELDWVGMCWGGDLTLSGVGSSKWDYRKFRGTRWLQAKSEVEQAYIRNRYRVLLTRARLGMVIWVPEGASTDATRDPIRFDRIFEYLKSCGVAELTDI